MGPLLVTVLRETPMPGPSQNRNRAYVNRVVLLAAIAVLVATALYLIVVSPLLFARAGDENADWSQYADIGTAYGGVSAVLSGLALCGIVGSLVLQRRQGIAEQIAAERQRHFDIISLSLNDLELLAAIEPSAADRPHARQEAYINLMMGYWFSMWTVGAMDETGVRQVVARMFTGEVGRNWWSRVRSYWADAYPQRHRRFVRFVNEEWHAAQSQHSGGNSLANS
jgi:hypothetical protein